MLRGLVAAGAALVTLWLATPSAAYLVEVTTSVSLADPANDSERDADQLKAALRSAVDDILKEAIAFKPTLIVLTAARVVGDRLYVRLLIADQDGERIVNELHKGTGARETVDQPI